jgi:2-polyprenyl-3-methyl-5-hydroxy-6-metoxy-1,4-benzoquinol methylase
LFERPDTTYDLDPDAVDRVLADPVNPLHHAARLIPKQSVVLDVGAGNGLLARVLAAGRRQVVIDGIEPNPRAAEIAAPFYRTFYVGQAEEMADRLDAERYDFLVLADVIEHTANPLEFLQTVTAIAPSARVLLSVPNVAFAAVRMALVHGRFDYVDSGLLERTHLRFFTLATLERLFELAALVVERRVLLKKSVFETEIDAAPTSLADVAELVRLRRDPLSSVYQIVFVLGRTDVEAAQEEYGKATTLAEILGAYRARRRVLGGRSS